MPSFAADAYASAEKSAVVLRCTCTEAQKAAPDWHGARGEPCPQARRVDLGVIAYWHRNPLRRLAWRIKQRLLRRIPGRFTFTAR